jgi:lipoprotein-anchoring transpeptidase ErfK/SrfK
MRFVKSPSMKRIFLFSATVAAAALLISPAIAQDRYGERPPLVVSPDLSAPWVMQLRQAPAGQQLRTIRRGGVTVGLAPDPVPRRQLRRADQFTERQLRQAAAFERQMRGLPRQGAVVQPDATARTAALAGAAPRAATPQLDPKFLPQTVAYDGPHKPGTIVIDTREKLLYLIEPGGQARRYGVGVGKDGFLWKGTENISQKREWPDWRPPAEMIEREKKKGRILPVHMKGGPENPLGARALYLGSTLYRIHGTNQPWTIGQNVSSGCIRMRNEDVMDLYERVKIGTKVVVI